MSELTNVRDMLKVGHSFAKKHYWAMEPGDRIYAVDLAITNILREQDSVHPGELCAWIRNTIHWINQYNNAEKRNHTRAGWIKISLDQPRRTSTGDASALYELITKPRLGDPERRIIAKMMIEDTLHSIAAALSEDDSRRWWWAAVSGYTYNEIAEMDGVSRSTVQRSIRRVKEYLGVDHIIRPA